jgi:hypothetical protein
VRVVLPGEQGRLRLLLLQEQGLLHQLLLLRRGRGLLHPLLRVHTGGPAGGAIGRRSVPGDY